MSKTSNLEAHMLKVVAVAVCIGLMLCIGAITTAHAQSLVPCVHPMHPAGDLVPCVHVIFTAYGPRHAHAADVVPCTHPMHPYGDIVY